MGDFGAFLIFAFALIALASLHKGLKKKSYKYARFCSDVNLIFIQATIENGMKQELPRCEHTFIRACSDLEQWMRYRKTRLDDLALPSVAANVQKTLEMLNSLRFAIAERKRKEEINKYFNFVCVPYAATAREKELLEARGGLIFFTNPIPLEMWPSFVAGLLKYKKHEWIVLGFEREKQIIFAWANKGVDAHGVSLAVDIESLVRMACDHKVTTVIQLHNHPNPNPNYYYMLLPSEADVEYAQKLSAVLEKHNIGLICLVCERGRWAEYWRYVPQSFLPVEKFLLPLPSMLHESR